MARNAARLVNGERQKNFAKLFDKACYRHNRWNVWSDFVVMTAISISNLVDKSNAESREKSYMALASKYSEDEMECFSQMLAETVCGIDECPDQDFLGELYMALELGNHNAGQFFTPYCVCTAMAKITGSDIKERIERDGWISVNDPACGAGALLVAFANECLRQGVNYQTNVLFVAQDIDMIVGCMCYIQLSLLGCPGYVCIDDSILRPCTCLDKRGLIPTPGERIWYTPFYFRTEWTYRRIWTQMDMLFQSAPRGNNQPHVEEPEPELKESKGGQLTLF
jgi:hypothetical protein